MKICGRDYEVIAFVDEEDYQRLRLWECGLSRLIRRSTTYICVHKNGKPILLHRLIMGLENGPSSVYVDHIDFNGLNNSRTNLRRTDSSGNQRHARKRLSGKKSSCYKGVSIVYKNKMETWEARIGLPGRKYKYLGHYETEKEAATAYNKAALELFGTMACLNDLSLPDHPCESA